ncbi:lysophospholipid acyltransferase family protein [Streptomyces fradiae]|uniref:lysophospholipid acyltransferase family protein n=1 Tax=Streptomyces fradiae TaxID=1906 RepID=UPI003517B4E1
MSTQAGSPWLPTAPCTPGRCAAHPGAAAPRGGTAAGALRLATGLAAVLLGVLLAPLAAPLPAAGRLLLVRLWCRGVLRAFGVRLRVTGRPVPGAGPLLVVANHISWLDIPLVAAVLPGRMLAKREVRGWPVLGPLAALGGTVFIDRDRLRSLPGTVATMAGALASGGRVIVFPEGSTWCGRARGPFRPAAFQAAVDAGAPIQPVRLHYTPVGPAGYVGDDSLGASLWRIATTRGLVAEIRLMEPISPEAEAEGRGRAGRASGRPARERQASDSRARGSRIPDSQSRDRQSPGRRAPGWQASDSRAWGSRIPGCSAPDPGSLDRRIPDAQSPDPESLGRRAPDPQSRDRRDLARRVLARAAEAAVALDPAAPVPLTLPAIPVQTTVASESANRPCSSVHQRDGAKPAAVSSARTPS